MTRQLFFLPNNVHDVKTSLLPFLHITIEFEELVVNFVTDASVFVHLELVGAFGYLAGVFERHVQTMLHFAWKGRTGLVGIIAYGDSIVPVFV